VIVRDDVVGNAAEAATLTRAAVTAGARFVWCYADVESAGNIVLRYVVDEAGRLVVRSGVVDGAVPALDLAAARWHERELVQDWSVTLDPMPEGGSPVTPQPAELYRRVSSPEVSAVLYGPIRSGIGESARWVIETAGEDFIAVAPSFGYKRRGLEARFVGVPLELAPLVAEHVSGATAASHATAFARAVEMIADIHVTPRARAARTMLVELERIHQHLDALAKLADDGSLSVGAAQTFAAKERVHRLLAEGVGNRFARGVVCVGGTRFDAFSRLAEACSLQLDRVEREAASVVDALLATPSLVDRLVGTGRLSENVVREYGGVGPVARGSGVPCDARATDGWIFSEQEADEVLGTAGDALARAHVRRDEMHRAFRLVRNALDAAPPGAWRVDLPRLLHGAGMSRVESPQGELIYAVRIDGTLQRVAIRSASFQNWPLFVPALPGNIFTDFSFIEHSFGLIVAETDR
jgi:Ni,Fe-hydrogenase III large subunit